jgi:hypothetical protein
VQHLDMAVMHGDALHLQRGHGDAAGKDIAHRLPPR